MLQMIGPYGGREEYDAAMSPKQSKRFRALGSVLVVLGATTLILALVHHSIRRRDSVEIIFHAKAEVPERVTLLLAANGLLEPVKYFQATYFHTSVYPQDFHRAALESGSCEPIAQLPPSAKILVLLQFDRDTYEYETTVLSERRVLALTGAESSAHVILRSRAECTLTTLEHLRAAGRVQSPAEPLSEKVLADLLNNARLLGLEFVAQHLMYHTDTIRNLLRTPDSGALHQTLELSRESVRIISAFGLDQFGASRQSLALIQELRHLFDAETAPSSVAAALSDLALELRKQ